MPYVPLEWLAQHVELAPDVTAADLAAALVKVGIEEEVIHQPLVTGPLVIGQVLSRKEEPQKNGKVINYCRVDVGCYNDAPGTGKEPNDLPSKGIICGAHNFEVGDYVVVALPGAVLPGDFAIAARKTYGHISDGMMCSLTELGIADSSEGIIIAQKMFPDQSLTVGEDAKEILGITGELLEVNVTPDRGYCFSMRGLAREYGHATGAKFIDPGLATNYQGKALIEANEKGFPVLVEDENPIYGQNGCDRFITQVVRGLNPQAPTPKWMRQRLQAAGMRSISLAVDVTNYVMLDLGQPLHAYDLDKLVAPFVVRRAKAGEKLSTLDGLERQLNIEDLLVCDSQGGKGQRALGLAGVMGGASTEISESTCNVLIESAHFDPISVARTARRHKIPSESAKRNERGTDPQIVALAAAKCADLLVEYGGGELTDEVFEYNCVPEPLVIDFDYRQAERLTGVSYSKDRVAQILQEIGCQLDAKADEHDKWLVTVPSWRPDLVGGAHLVEEIARIDGYDQIPVAKVHSVAGLGLSLTQKWRRDIARTIAEQGWTQVLSYPFVGDMAEQFNIGIDDPRRKMVKIANPLVEAEPYLRTSILDTLFATAQRNIARQAGELAIYEIDRLILPKPLNKQMAGRKTTSVDGGMDSGTLPLMKTVGNPVSSHPTPAEVVSLEAATGAQPLHVAGIAAGLQYAPSPYGTPREWDWADAVNQAVEISALVGVQVELANTEYAPWHPGRCAVLTVNKVKDNGSCETYIIGHAGEIHPEVSQRFGLPGRVIAFEIDLSLLFSLARVEPKLVDPVSVFPLAKEDFSFVVPVDMPAAHLLNAVRTAAGNFIERAIVSDVFTGEQLGAGNKSVTIALHLRHPEQTLDAKMIGQLREQVIVAAKQLGAELRS